MFCSTCGTEVIKGLNYCKNCGVRVGGTANDTATNSLSDASFNTLVGCVFALPIAGIGIIIGLLVVMKKELEFEDPMIAIVTLISFLMLILAEISLIRLLTQHTKKPKETTDAAPHDRDVVLKSFKQAQTLGLGEGNRDPIPSVVENTTRNLEPVYRETNQR